MGNKRKSAAGGRTLGRPVRCGSCAFFHGFTKRPRKGYRVVYGQCRMTPPRPDITDEFWQENKHVPARWIFPKVHSDLWCGCHTPNKEVSGPEHAAKGTP